jgi:xylan 1,4-beta-xylosidase
MFGLLGSERVKATSSGVVPTEEVVSDGVRGRSDVNVIATRKDHEIEVLVWNYHDDDLAATNAAVDLEIDGLPPAAAHGIFEHFRIDSSHSNAFTAWKELGSPSSLSPGQNDQLRREGQLELLTSPGPISIANHSAHLQFELPRQGLSLVRLTW